MGGVTFRQPAFSIRACSRCGLYFKSRTLPLDSLEAYAEHRDFSAYEADEDFPTDRILRRALGRLPVGRKILDFGCNTGRILKAFASGHDCYGVEINAAAAAIAGERGIRIVSEAQLQSGEQRDFDFIVLADVYEHLPQPLEFLGQLMSALKAGGRLAVITGNADAIRTRDLMAEYWYFTPPEHLLMMGERHVEWLAGRIGATLEELHRCSHYSIPVSRRAIQCLQSYVYFQFRRNPRGAVSKMLRKAPTLRRAERWPRAPALSYRPDHFVAIFQKR